MQLKENVNFGDFQMIHPNLLAMLGYFVAFAHQNNLPVTITSITSDTVVKRVSTTHRDGRAFDASLKEWSEEKITELAAKMNGKFYDVAALSFSDNLPRAVVVHGENNNRHFHIQCRK